MNPFEYEVFDVQIREGVVVARVHGTDDLNLYPIDRAYDEFLRLATDMRSDDALRVLVLTGTGAVFSMGNEPLTGATARTRITADLARVKAREYVLEFLDLDKPVVTALNGPVMGGIVTLVVLSDIVVAEEHAAIRDLHVPIGSVPSTGAFLWPPSIGLLKAKRYLLTGDWMPAQEAERLGLVTEVVGRGRALARAIEYADRLASLPAASLGGTKRALNQWLRSEASTIFDFALSTQFLTITTAAEGFHRREYDLREELAAALRLSSGPAVPPPAP